MTNSEDTYRFECRFCTNGTDNEDEDCGCRHEEITSNPKELYPAQSQGRDWTEDRKHENGNYQNQCHYCGGLFIGHKRRQVCKLCDQVNQLLQERETMLATIAELKHQAEVLADMVTHVYNAVIVLPDDAEPIEGDWCEIDLEYNKSFGDKYAVVLFIDTPQDCPKLFRMTIEPLGLSDEDLSEVYICRKSIKRIDKRHGKPVIYQSQLKDVK